MLFVLLLLLLLLLPASSSSDVRVLPPCLPLCCGEDNSTSCARVSMADGSSLSGAVDVCSPGFYSADGFYPATFQPRCASGKEPHDVDVGEPRRLRGRRITNGLYEVCSNVKLWTDCPILVGLSLSLRSN